MCPFTEEIIHKNTTIDAIVILTRPFAKEVTQTTEQIFVLTPVVMWCFLKLSLSGYYRCTNKVTCPQPSRPYLQSLIIYTHFTVVKQCKQQPSPIDNLVHRVTAPVMIYPPSMYNAFQRQIF